MEALDLLQDLKLFDAYIIDYLYRDGTVHIVFISVSRAFWGEAAEVQTA